MPAPSNHPSPALNPNVPHLQNGGNANLPDFRSAGNPDPQVQRAVSRSLALSSERASELAELATDSKNNHLAESSLRERGHLRERDSDGHRKDTSTVALIKDAFSEAFAIVEAHVELAAVELREDAHAVARIAAASAVGCALLVLTLGFLAAAAAFALAIVYPAWLACLIVGGGLFLTALLAFVIARIKLKQRDFKPERTIASLKENGQWIAEKMN